MSTGPRLPLSGDLRGALYDDAVFGDGHGHVEDVHFLKAVVPQLREGDVARYGDERYAVHIGVRKPRHEVGGTGSGCRQHHARMTAPPRVALGGETRTLLVRGEHVAYGRHRECVVDGEYASPRIAEYVAHALFLKAAHEDLRTACQHFPFACGARTLKLLVLFKERFIT